MDFTDIELSFRVWRLWKLTGHLPYIGGTLDQPEWLMDDIMTWELAEQRWLTNNHG